MRAIPDWGIYVPLVLILFFLSGVQAQGDTVALATGAENARLCIAEMKIPCNRNVVHFPLFQYLLAWLALFLGADVTFLPRIIAHVNIAFAVAASILFFRIGGRAHGKQGAHAALALLYSGYVVYYFFSSFGEIASFTLFASFCAAVYTKKSAWLVAILAMFCCITKETAPPFTLLICLAAWLAATGAAPLLLPRSLWPALVPSLVGIAAGVALNIGFNAFRFGSWSNVALLDPNLRAPASAVTAYFAYLFISPAGGLVYAWLSLCAFTVAAVIAARKHDQALIVMAMAALLVIGTNAGLAFWFSSFGWYAWGPRLTLPILGAAAMLVLLSCEDLLCRLADPRKRWLKVAAVFAVLFASALPNMLVLIAPDGFFSRMFAPGTVTRILGPDASILQKAGPEVFKFGAMEVYGRPVLVPTTVMIARDHVFVVVLCAVYCALASWRICRGRP